MEEIDHLTPNKGSFITEARQSHKSRLKRNSFYRNYLRQESKRFSKNILSDSFVSKKETFMKLFILHLQTRPENRTEEDVQATAKILAEENIFPEFKNDIKILRLLAKNLNLLSFGMGEKIYSAKSQDVNLYKVVEGYVVLQGNNQRIVKDKGDFLETINNFSFIKTMEALSFSQTYLLSINHLEYQLVYNLYVQNKVIVKMLKTTPLLKAFTANQINSLVEHSDTKIFCQNQTVISEGEDFSHLSKEEKKIYYLVEGEINVYKNSNIVCTLSENCIVGEQLLFFDFPCPYTAKIKSLYAKILLISHKTFLDLVKNTGKTLEGLEEETKYTETIKSKLQHYDHYVKNSQKIKSTVFERVASKSLDSYKREKLQKYINAAGLIEKKINDLEKISSKRMNASNEINFCEPLFRREDFPLLQNSLKRFANEEKIALQKLKVSKALFVR